MLVWLKDKRDGTERWVPLEEANRLLNTELGEIEWALDAFGEFETDSYIVLNCV